MDEVAGLGQDRFSGDRAVDQFEPMRHALAVPLMSPVQCRNDGACVEEDVPRRHLFTPIVPPDPLRKCVLLEGCRIQLHRAGLLFRCPAEPLR